MVVFTHGVSDKSEYRKFKTRKDHNNDFFNMNETLGRRLSEKNLKAWGKPDLILIDGGKGQLDAALKARDEAGCKMPFIGLAKREEQIVIDKNRSNLTLNIDVLHKLGGYTTESEDFILVNVPHTTNVVKLLQRIRDESHRFAVSYHSVLKVKHQTMSLLDEIPGVGPATRKKLLKEFGSLRAIQAAGSKDLEASIGSIKGQYIFKYLHDQSIGIPKPSSVETSSS
jgi:excinuclease ABC subunit C